MTALYAYSHRRRRFLTARRPRNHNLEEFLDARYEEIISKSCHSLALSEIADRITDGTHNTVIDSPGNPYYLLSCKNLKGGQLNIGSAERKIDFVTFHKLRQRTKLCKWDILLSSVGTIGEIVLLKEDPSLFEFQRSVAMIKASRYSPFIVYSALRRQRTELIHAAHGAVQQCLFLSDIGSFELTLPKDPVDTLEFSRLSAITHTMISEREKENTELTLSRDSLLPKLLSGEFTISNKCR